MAWPERATRVVNQFPGRGQTIWLDFKFFPLHKEERCQRSEQQCIFSHTATRDRCSLVRASDRTWRSSTGRPTALPHPRLAATGRWPPSYSPERPASRCVTRESRRGAGERDSPPATHQTQEWHRDWQVQGGVSDVQRICKQPGIWDMWSLVFTGEAEEPWWGGRTGNWAELMLHQKAFTAVCYLIDVHSSQGQAQDNRRSILLLILKEQKSQRLIYKDHALVLAPTAGEVAGLLITQMPSAHLVFIMFVKCTLPCWPLKYLHLKSLHAGRLRHFTSICPSCPGQESCSFSDLRVWTSTALRGTLRALL